MMSTNPSHRCMTIALLTLAFVLPSNLLAASETGTSETGTSEAGTAGITTIVVPPGGRLALATPSDPEARYEAAFDGGLLQPVTEVIAPDSGRHWLTVVSRDAAGNLSQPRFLQVWVDGEVPFLNFEVTPRPVEDTIRRLWVPPGATADLHAEDAPAGVAELVLEVGAETVSSKTATSLTAQLPATGAVEIRLWAVDTVGNRTETATVSLNVDATPPRGDIRLQGEELVDVEIAGTAVLVTSPRVQLQARVSDPETGLDRWMPSLNGTEVSLEEWRRELWPAGSYRAEVTAVDRVGNEGALEPLDFLVDAEGPAITWKVISDGIENHGVWVYRPPITLELIADDDLAGVADLGWQPPETASSRVLSSETSGKSAARVVVDGDALSVRATDRVGNVAEIEVGWRIDRDGPRFLLRTPYGGSVAPGGTIELFEGQAVHIAAEDAGAGVATQEVAVDGIHWTVAPREVRFPDQGRNRLVARAVDRLGHRSEATWDVRVRPRSEQPVGQPAGKPAGQPPASVQPSSEPPTSEETP